MPRFHELRVARVARETPDAVSIAFDVPDELKETFAFTPGQHLTLRSPARPEVGRCYSICSGLGDPELRVAVKEQPGGAFSPWANRALKAGDRLLVAPPEGRFTIDIAPGGERDYVAIAAGSGITPVISQIKSVLAHEPKSRCTLFYCNRSVGSIIFKAELEDLKDRYLDRLQVFHFLTRERREDVDLFSGRMDPQRIAALASAGLLPRRADGYYLCGPAQMARELRETLRGLGIDRRAIHIELFVIAEEDIKAAQEARRARLAERGASSSGARVQAVLDGDTFTFEIVDDMTIVDSGRRAGLDMPFSCKGGMCATCRAKVTEGHAEMDINYALTEDEVAQGFILTCQAHPTTQRLVVDYDV